jgi:hypothetical protein
MERVAVPPKRDTPLRFEAGLCFNVLRRCGYGTRLLVRLASISLARAAEVGVAIMSEIGIADGLCKTRTSG